MHEGASNVSEESILPDGKSESTGLLKKMNRCSQCLGLQDFSLKGLSSSQSSNQSMIGGAAVDTPRVVVDHRHRLE